MKRRSAFTLIEAGLVLVLIALMTAGSVLALRGRLNSARIEDAVGRLIEFDRFTREASRSQKLGLHFALNAGTLRRTNGAVFNPGGRFRITRVWTDAGMSQSGELTIPFSRRGQSPAYAMLLEGPASRQWIVIAGMTGKAILIQDERELDNLFADATSASARRDAD